MSFLVELRDRSAYPTYRGIVTVVVVIGYIAAVAAAGAGLLAADGPNGFLTVGLALAGALVIILATYLLRDVLLMVADIADASIVTAAQVVKREGAPVVVSEPPPANLDWEDARREAP